MTRSAEQRREWLTRMGDAEEGLSVSAGARTPQPESVQQAVERLRAWADAMADGAVNCTVFVVDVPGLKKASLQPADLRLVLAALAEAQRERDAWKRCCDAALRLIPEGL